MWFFVAPYADVGEVRDDFSGKMRDCIRYKCENERCTLHSDGVYCAIEDRASRQILYCKIDRNAFSASADEVDGVKLLVAASVFAMSEVVAAAERALFA